MSCILPLAHASLSSSVLMSGVRLLPEPSVDLRAASSGLTDDAGAFHEDRPLAPIAERLVDHEESSARGFGEDLDVGGVRLAYRRDVFRPRDDRG